MSTPTPPTPHPQPLSTRSQQQISLLAQSLSTLATTASAASSRCTDLTLRSHHLDSLTSPASDASAALTQASSNLTATLALLKDAREKYDTVGDCEPAIDRLMRGAQESLDTRTTGVTGGGTVGGGGTVMSAGMFSVPNHDNRSVIEFGSAGGGGGADRHTSGGKFGNHPMLGLVPNDAASLIGSGVGTATRWNDDDTLTLGGGTIGGGTIGGGTIVGLTEQDVYAAADSMEILRDAHSYFAERPKWKSANGAMMGLERVHGTGVEGMCILVKSHLIGAGIGIRFKRRMYRGGGDAGTVVTRGESTIVTTGTFAASTQINIHQEESAADTRGRLSAALQIRDLMRAVGEYEEHLPLDTRSVRELRAIFECLGEDGFRLPPLPDTGPDHMDNVTDVGNNLKMFQVEANKLRRTEKIGSGFYTNLVQIHLNSGYPHLDAYAYARRRIVFQSMDNYYRQLKMERRKAYTARQMMMSSGKDIGAMEMMGDLDAGARDCVRCIEHAMVIVSGEKSIYRCVVSPTASHTHDDTKVSAQYKRALASSYSHVVSTAVDRIMDVVELFFVKDANLRHSNPANSSIPPRSSNAGPSSSSETNKHNDDAFADVDSATAMSGAGTPSVRVAASAAAAVLRILDGVRMLGPSLSRLCDLANSADKRQLNQHATGEGVAVGNGANNGPTLASSLCIGLHRTAVKSGAKALENLASAIKQDPFDGENFRPGDARVAAVSSDAVRAMRLVSPFVNAYKSVTKRRTLPWDPKIGDAAGDMDFFIRYLTMTLLINLETKAANYSRDPGLSSQAKSYLFLMNNTFYLLEQLGPEDKNSDSHNMQKPFNADEDFDGADYRITSPWFTDQVCKIFDASMKKYLGYWDVLNKHLTPVPKKDLQYQNERLLNLESGRLLKARFSKFNDSFEETYAVHRELTVIDPKLRVRLLEDVKRVFLPRYIEFYQEYAAIKFSKKNMEEYLKYPPNRVDSMMSELFSA